ncbi:MAG: ABC transporter substrate-binding protein [Rhizobiaceae bacterium]|nr:ABC transporter substrate-binding protein [Rhizobiaceae bacterium]MCV0408578.1 ABC transporter substrate-binding protein [Rhizobiaceae bacterium]
MKTMLAAFAAMFMATTASFADKLVLYTSQPNSDAQQTVDAFMAANPDIEVEWVREGTTKLMAKLAAEMEAGQTAADLLLIADTVTLEAMKREGRLMAYKSPEAANYDEALYDADGHYYSTKMITTGIMYNTAAKMKPTGWSDLTRPEAKGMTRMPSPLTSGAALIHAAALTGMEEFGWDYYQALKDNETQAGGGNGDVFKAVASGEKAYGVVVDFVPIREKAKGAPVEFVFPEEGVSVVTEPVAILASAKNPDAARKFVDFLLSEQGQELVVSQGYIPARNGIALPEGYPARDEIRLLPFDAGQALENAEANKQKFAEIFGAE